MPIIENVRIQFDTSQPELSLNIDRDKANDLGVPMARISETLRVMVDDFDLLDLSVEDQAVPVMVGSARGAINDPDDLLNIGETPLDDSIDKKELYKYTTLACVLLNLEETIIKS